MDQLRKDNITVWEHYSQKLHKIEQHLDKTKGESSSDINAIKLEFQSLRELYGKLKSCCDQSASVLRSEEIEKQVDRAVAGYFGDGVPKQEFNRIVESLLIANSDKKSIKTMADGASSGENGEPVCSGTSSMSDQDVQKIVNAVLKIYDADKTGRVDYALESAGTNFCHFRIESSLKENLVKTWKISKEIFIFIRLNDSFDFLLEFLHFSSKMSVTNAFSMEKKHNGSVNMNFSLSRWTSDKHTLHATL